MEESFGLRILLKMFVIRHENKAQSGGLTRRNAGIDDYSFTLKSKALKFNISNCSLLSNKTKLLIRV